MTETRLSLGPPSSGYPRHGRWKRIVFLSLSAAIALFVMLVSHDVMMPFVMALVLAYVLTPLVAILERRRIPRGVAIILVYTAVFGSGALLVRAIAPRIGAEIGSLRRELPVMMSRAREEWIPKAQEKLEELGIAPQAPDPEADTSPPEPAFLAKPRPDGAIEIEIGSGVALKKTNGGFVIEKEPELSDERFDLNKLVSEATSRSLAYAQHNALELARLGRDIVAGISRVVFKFFITLMLAAYVMLTRERILAFFESLVRPSARDDFRLLLARMDRGLAGVVRGQLIICVVNGVLSAIGFAIVGLKYWPVLALIATVFSLIPIFGSIISTIPAVALGLTQSIGTATFVLVWIIAIHQLEANLLNPKIMGDAAKIHPVLVVFSLLVGEHFFGPWGALLAVPTMSMAQSVFIHFRNVVQREDPELAPETNPSLPPPPPVTGH
jgi:predicted PurR-regulated permease PerM